MKYNIGITGTGSLIGQGIIKSIKNSEYADQYNLIGFDYFEENVGKHWVDQYYILPDILDETVSEADWLNSLVAKIEAEKLRVLFVGVDFELPILADARAKIEAQTGCSIMVSGANVIEIGNDKYLTYQFLKDNGLFYPETNLPNEVDFESLTFPVIVKPRVGARSVGVYKVNSIDELKDSLAKVKEPIIQEYIGNEDSEYTCGLLYLTEELQNQIVLKRSLKQGNTFISEYSDQFSDKIYNYIKAIGKKLKPYGACNLQLRVNKEGNPILFEINPRHSGTTYMRTLFGYNEVIFILKYLLEKEQISFELKNGKAMRFYEEKLL